MPPLRGNLAAAMRPAPRPRPTLSVGSQQEPPSLVAEVHRSIEDEQRMQDTRYFRPSGIGGCLREGYYLYAKAQKSSEKLPPRVQLIFDVGSADHEILQKWLGMSTRFFVHDEVTVWIPTLEVFGHVDLVLIDRVTQYGFMGEIKSINNEGYSRLTKPKPEHRSQANLYLGLLLRQSPWLAPWFVVLYFNKDNQSLREFKCRFDKALFEESLSWTKEIKQHFVAKMLPPYDPRDCDEAKCRYVAQCKRAR